MNEVTQTLDGWYTMHDFRTINWSSWKKLRERDRQLAINELRFHLKQWGQIEDKKLGSTGTYTIVGQKADLYFVHMRESLEELNELENTFNKTSFAEHTRPVYSFLSVVELSNYIATSSETDLLLNQEIIARLKPTLPKTKHICFYPMNKRREGNDNWYILSMEERRLMMRSHSKIGRHYAGKVKQVITGSAGLDDWEWGVILFADDALHFKKLIYEMRFDEVSARFGEFGSFYVGNLLTEEMLSSMLEISDF